MPDRVSHLFHRLPIGSPQRRLAFSVLAVFLAALELAALLTSDKGFDALSVEWIVVCYAILALTGWSPAVGGVLFTMYVIAGILTPGTSIHFTFALLGVYGVAADWISRRWYIPAFLALASTEAAQLSHSSSPTAEAFGIVFGVAVAVAIGLSLQWNSARVKDLETQAEDARRAADEAGKAVRHDLTVNLHDTVAQDLTRVIVSSQSIARRTTDRQAGEDIEALGELARHAMRQVRALIDDAGLSHTNPTEPLANVLATCQAMLAGRSITLAAELPDDVDSTHSLRQRAILALAMREGSTNVFKYARTGSRATLTLEELDDGAVAFTMVNDIDPASDDVRGTLSGGFGLENLITRAAREGGRVRFGSNGGRWVLTMLVPGPASRDSVPSTISSDGTPTISVEEAGA